MPAQLLQKSTQTNSTGGSAPASGGASPDRQPAGNDAAQASVKARVSGPMGRVWNHILGQPEGADTADAQVDQAMIRAYLEKKAGFAEGEMFRGVKLDGASAALVKQYDADHDGKLSWHEFQAFEGTLSAMLAPDAGKVGASEAASRGFAATDTSGDGAASLDEMQSAAQRQLPKGTDHADLVAQLGARVAIDAVDRDEKNKPVAQRSVSRSEWTGAAKELAGSRGGTSAGTK
jgi:hypothetical protein